MFNLQLYKKVKEKFGIFWTGGVDDALIRKLSNNLNVKLPESYINFIKKFGEGGFGSVYFNGITDAEYSSCYEETLKFREKYKINKKWVVVADESNDWEEYILCLDTSRMKDNECPIVKYDYEHLEEEDYKENFYELFNYKCEVLLND